MTNERKINLTSKPLCDFRAGDTLYIQKLERDHNYSYLCEFIELKRGIVVAKVVERMQSSKLSGRPLAALPLVQKYEGIVEMKKTRHKFLSSCPDCQRDKKLRSIFLGAKKVLLHNSSPASINAVMKVLRGGVEDILSKHGKNLDAQ